MMLPLAIAAAFVALSLSDAAEDGPTMGDAARLQQALGIEDCVYDRELEYLGNKQPQTDDADARAVKIVLDICIGHGLPLLPNERAAVKRGLDRAFEEAIKELGQRR